jgi:hypothetical protein
MGKLQNNPSIGCVHPKSTHAWPLAWGNKNLKINKTESFYSLVAIILD